MALHPEPHGRDLVHEDLRQHGIAGFEYSCVLPDKITMNGEFDPTSPADERVARIIDLNEFQADGQDLRGSSPESPEPDVADADRARRGSVARSGRETDAEPNRA